MPVTIIGWLHNFRGTGIQNFSMLLTFTCHCSWVGENIELETPHSPNGKTKASSADDDDQRVGFRLWEFRAILREIECSWWAESSERHVGTVEKCRKSETLLQCHHSCNNHGSQINWKRPLRHFGVESTLNQDASSLLAIAKFPSDFCLSTPFERVRTLCAAGTSLNTPVLRRRENDVKPTEGAGGPKSKQSRHDGITRICCPCGWFLYLTQTMYILDIDQLYIGYDLS